MMYDPSLSAPGTVFTEEDQPNIQLGPKPAPMYCQLRVLEEQLLQTGGYTGDEGVSASSSSITIA